MALDMSEARSAILVHVDTVPQSILVREDRMIE